MLCIYVKAQVLKVACTIMSEAYDDEDAGYGSENESYEARVGAPVRELPIEAPAMPQELVHIKPKQVYGKQSMRMVFSNTMTPTQLQAKGVVSVGLSPANQKLLLQNNAMQNRHAPRAEDVAGNLDQIILVGLMSAGYVNGHLQPATAKVKGQIPTFISNEKQGSVNMECTGGLFQPDRHNALSPMNIFIRDMLEIWETCDATVLPKEFQVLSDPNTGINQCLVYTKGSAASILSTFPQEFGNYRFQENNLVGMNMAIVPNHIAKKLYTYMEDTISDIRKSFTSAKDFEVTFEPQSDRWDDVKSFIGRHAVLDADKQMEFEAKAKNTPARMSVSFDVDWICVSNIYDDATKNQATTIKGLGA